MSLLPTAYYILSIILNSGVAHTYAKLLGIFSVDFDVTDRVMTGYQHSSDTAEKVGM